MQVLSRRQIPKNGDHDGLHLLRTGIQCRTQLCECVQKCSGQQKRRTKNSKRLNGQERGKNVLSQTCWVSFYHLYIAHQLKTLKQGRGGGSVKLVDGSRSYMLTVPRTLNLKLFLSSSDEDACGISIITEHGTEITGSTRGGSFPSSPCQNAH